jgi:DNA-binding PadR family transcriptional regulator
MNVENRVVLVELERGGYVKSVKRNGVTYYAVTKKGRDRLFARVGIFDCL